MRKLWFQITAGLFLVLGIFSLALFVPPVRASSQFQQVTPVLPTVTGTPNGPMAVVIPQPETQINLRSGPNTKYDKVGVLLVGQKVPAKGRSPGGEWVLVEYPGVAGGVAWVWSAYIKIEPPTDLPIVEPPTHADSTVHHDCGSNPRRKIHRYSRADTSADIHPSPSARDPNFYGIHGIRCWQYPHGVFHPWTDSPRGPSWADFLRPGALSFSRRENG